MSIEQLFLISNYQITFEEYKAHMNFPKQQAMFKYMGVKIFILVNL